MPGVDLLKPRQVIEAAYNDQQGLTAQFNLKLLRRINRELRADIKPYRFEHRALYYAQQSRVEMHLISQGRQAASVAGKAIAFQDGELILTESSSKYTLDGFAELAQSAGVRVEQVWTDADQWFSVQCLTID